MYREDFGSICLVECQVKPKQISNKPSWKNRDYSSRYLILCIWNPYEKEASLWKNVMPMPLYEVPHNACAIITFIAAVGMQAWWRNWGTRWQPTGERLPCAIACELYICPIAILVLQKPEHVYVVNNKNCCRGNSVSRWCASSISEPFTSRRWNWTNT